MNCGMRMEKRAAWNPYSPGAIWCQALHKRINAGESTPCQQSNCKYLMIRGRPDETQASEGKRAAWWCKTLGQYVCEPCANNLACSHSMAQVTEKDANLTPKGPNALEIPLSISRGSKSFFMHHHKVRPANHITQHKSIVVGVTIRCPEPDFQLRT
ncbi:hypothetical protein BKA81DRAFT_120558 [Phyllosticta paracitricarpa]